MFSTPGPSRLSIWWRSALWLMKCCLMKRSLYSQGGSGNATPWGLLGLSPDGAPGDQHYYVQLAKPIDGYWANGAEVRGNLWEHGWLKGSCLAKSPCQQGSTHQGRSPNPQQLSLPSLGGSSFRDLHEWVFRSEDIRAHKLLSKLRNLRRP